MHENSLVSTVLREGEAIKAREEEFLRAKDLFYRFTNKDPLGRYELNQVMLLANPTLEAAFAREFCALAEAYSLSTATDVIRYPGSEEEVRKSS